MAIDRSKYRSSSSEELKNESEKVQEITGSDARGAFIKIEAGINTLRFFPAPLKANSSLFRFPKVTSFLPFMVDEVDKDGNKTGKKVRQRKAIFNAQVHGGLERDIVSEYIECAKEYFESTCKSKKEAFEKLKPLTDWKTGIKAATAWVAYGYKQIGKKKIYGRIQITDGVNKQLDTLSTRADEEGRPIVVDLYSHPDTGKKIQWTSDPQNADAKAKNKISVIFEEDAPLTDEELEMLESMPSLESLYKDSYTRKDFQKQLEGLQLFDKENKLGIFDSNAFQSKIEMVREEIEEKLPEEDEDEEDENEKKSVKKFSKKKVVEDEEEDEMPTILEDMDKKTLMFLIEKLELEVKAKVTTPPSKIRQMIKEAIISSYELEGSNSSINKAIVNIIEDVMSNQDEDDQEKASYEEEEVEYEEESDSYEEEKEDDTNEEESSKEEEQDEQEEEVEEKPAPKKRSSLMEKYGKKKSN